MLISMIINPTAFRTDLSCRCRLQRSSDGVIRRLSIRLLVSTPGASGVKTKAAPPLTGTYDREESGQAPAGGRHARRGRRGTASRRARRARGRGACSECGHDGDARVHGRAQWCDATADGSVGNGVEASRSGASRGDGGRVPVACTEERSEASGDGAQRRGRRAARNAREVMQCRRKRERRRREAARRDARTVCTAKKGGSRSAPRHGPAPSGEASVAIKRRRSLQVCRADVPCRPGCR